MEISARKQELIAELIDVTRVVELIRRKVLGDAVDAYVTYVGQAEKENAFDLIARFKRGCEVLYDEHAPMMVSGIEGIYGEHLDEEVLEVLVNLYRSDVGKKLIASMTAITGLIQNLGTEWAATIFPKIEELQEQLESEPGLHRTL